MRIFDNVRFALTVVGVITALAAAMIFVSFLGLIDSPRPVAGTDFIYGGLVLLSSIGLAVMEQYAKKKRGGAMPTAARGWIIFLTVVTALVMFMVAANTQKAIVRVLADLLLVCYPLGLANEVIEFIRRRKVN